MSSNDQNLKRSVEHDASHSLSRIFTGQDSNMSSSDQNLKRSVEHDTSHSLSKNCTGRDSSMSCNSKLSSQNNETEQSGSINGLEKNDTSQNEIIKLLRQVIEQNSIMLSDIKALKGHHILTMRNNLYKRPHGFPLKTVEEFKELETDTDRLQELLTYLKFVGGIKLREALSHFQKETMTDELTCKFTYWGRTKESLPFYNTQIAKVYFYAAKTCPNFKGPETRAEFKLEIMEVFRAAKQRQYLKNNKATLEMEEMCSEDTGSNDTDGIPETEDLDASNESE